MNDSFREFPHNQDLKMASSKTLVVLLAVFMLCGVVFQCTDAFLRNGRDEIMARKRAEMGNPPYEEMYQYDEANMAKARRGTGKKLYLVCV